MDSQLPRFLVDLSKAVDMTIIRYSSLWNSWCYITLVQNLLNSVQFVSIENVIADTGRITIGVPQGLILVAFLIGLEFIFCLCPLLCILTGGTIQHGCVPKPVR